MILNKTNFCVYFAEPPQPTVDVWDTLIAFLRSELCLPGEFRLSQIAGHPDEQKIEREFVTDADGVGRCIIDRNLNAFAVDAGQKSGVTRYRLLPVGKSTVLAITLSDKSQTPTDWSKLIEGLLIQWEGLFGLQWHAGYAAWQNAVEIRSYETLYGPIPVTAKKVLIPSSGDSPARETLDISKNPGRTKQLIPGAHFRPSAEMWLGPHFWQYAACTKDEILAQNFFLNVRDTRHFLYLKSWPEPFTRPDGEQGRIQQKLWNLLFQEDCEWPPGSLDVSVKPMYGPVGLLPQG